MENRCLSGTGRRATSSDEHCKVPSKCHRGRFSKNRSCKRRTAWLNSVSVISRCKSIRIGTHTSPYRSNFLKCSLSISPQDTFGRFLRSIASYSPPKPEFSVVSFLARLPSTSPAVKSQATTSFYGPVKSIDRVRNTVVRVSDQPNLPQPKLARRLSLHDQKGVPTYNFLSNNFSCGSSQNE